RAWVIVLLICGGLFSQAQSTTERTFRQSKTEIERALQAMHSSLSGRLPVLDGFSQAADLPLERYQRGFFQASAKVISAPDGGSVVRIHTKITAWYADPVAAKSGYQLLTSNGRIESDILDQLAERLNTSALDGSSQQQPSTIASNQQSRSLISQTFPNSGKR